MATVDASVKMGVTGVSKFKSDMNQAKQAVKTLDAQLALTEKQFKQSGDAESYMTEKAELLKAKLEQQKSALASAEKALDQMAAQGVNKASKAYQDMYRSMLRVKGEMIDTENAISGVADASDEAADEVSDLSNQLDSINRGVRLENVTNGIGKITDALAKAGAKAYELGKKIVNEVLGAGSWADDLQTRAAYYGLTPEQLQRMDKTSRLIDTSTDTIIKAQQKLRMGIGKADEGVMGAFAALFGEGYAPKENGWEKAFWDAGQAIMKFTNEEEKEVYAQKLFGRSWNELIPLFDAGKEKYDELNASWKVVSQEQIDGLQKMDDEYQTLQANWETFKMDLLSAFSGPMTQGMEKLNGLMAKFIEYVNSPEGQEMLESISDTLIKGLEWLLENWQSVAAGIGAIGAAFAGLKLAELGTNVWRVVNGFRQLTGGGGNAPTTQPTNAPTTAPTGGGGGSVGTAGTAGMSTALKAGLSEFTQTAALALPIGVLIDGIVENVQWLNESLEKGEESIAKYAELESQLGGGQNWEDLSALYGYLHIRNAGEGSGEAWADMDKLSERWQAWRNDELQSELFDRMWENMDGETAQRFMKAMNLYANNANLDPEGMQEQVWGPMKEGLQYMEEAAAELSGDGADKVKDGGDAVKDAAKDMGKLPEETAAAVAKALNNSAVVIDGGALSAVVGSYMADVMANYRAG